MDLRVALYKTFSIKQTFLKGVFKHFTFLLFLFLSFQSSLFAQENENLLSPTNGLKEFFLTPEEQIWVSEHPVVRVTNEMEWAPFDFVRAGEPAGFSIDYLNLVLGKVGLKPEYINGYTWEELLQQIEDKKIDIAHSLIQTQGRSEYLNFTKPYFDMRLGYFGKKGSKWINGERDLIGKKIGVVKGWGSDARYRKEHPALTLIEFPSVVEASYALANGQIDIYAGRVPIINYTLNKNFITNVEIIGNVVLPETGQDDNIRIGARKDWPELIKIIEKGMAAVTSKEYNDLLTKWQTNANADNKIDLTDAERNWLKENKIIRVAVDPDLIPIEFIDQNGKISGISGTYLTEIGKMLGVDFVWSKNKSWVEGYDKIKSGEAEILSAATSTPERRKYLTFTDSYMSLTSMIFTHEDNIQYRTMDDLYGRRIAAVKGYAVTDFIKQDYPDIEVVEVGSINEAMRYVASGKADAFIGGLMTGAPVIAEERLDEIVVAGESPYKVEEVIGIRSDLPLLASALQKAMRSFSALEKSSISSKWMSLKTEPRTDYALIWKIIAVSFVVLIAVLIWNARLHNEVQRRRVAEIKLRKSRKEAEKAKIDAEIAKAIAERSQREAEMANDAKTKFLANMSHEIRTPLNAIIGFSDVMTKGIFGEIHPPKYKEYLEDITSSGQHLAKVIGDILDLSKIEAGKWHLTETEFSLDECINNAIKMVKSKALQKKILISYVNEAKPLKLCGDAHSLKRVFINLLSNSVKYTDQGGAIICNVNQAEDNSVIIEIKDNGMGIPADRLDQVLNPFEQIEQSHDLNEEGTGLGLPIVKKLVELHGGIFKLKSEVNIGTSAFITIPSFRVLDGDETHQQPYPETKTAKQG